ncbi:MAG: Rrf2 family transcriptional regulator [Betaproteobacteria bacterium]
MRFSIFTDYSLRVLMYLGSQHERLATISEIAQFYGISENHLMKVVNQLGNLGYIETIRGKGGGMRLARDPKKIIIGKVIRDTETDFALAECFNDNSSCRIQSDCSLQTILSSALAGLFGVLDKYTLEDIIVKPNMIIQFIKR